MAELILNDGEQILDKVRANRYKNPLNADGGHIVITNQRLYFHAHAFNFDTSAIEIPLATIVEIKTFNSLGIVPKGLLVITQQGQTHKFVVNRRKQIITLIQSRITNP